MKGITLQSIESPMSLKKTRTERPCASVINAQGPWPNVGVWCTGSEIVAWPDIMSLCHRKLMICVHFMYFQAVGSLHWIKKALRNSTGYFLALTFTDHSYTKTLLPMFLPQMVLKLIHAAVNMDISVGPLPFILFSQPEEGGRLVSSINFTATHKVCYLFIFYWSILIDFQFFIYECNVFAVHLCNGLINHGCEKEVIQLDLGQQELNGTFRLWGFSMHVQLWLCEFKLCVCT